MPSLTAGEVARLCSGRLTGDTEATATAIVGDSREITDGMGFAAIRGGHAFVDEALTRGARFVLVDRENALPPDATGVVVDDVVRALAVLATEARSRLRVRCVGITGSTGKTLTKDFIAAVLSSRFRVHASPRSFNTEVGVPLVVVSCPDDAEVLVVEMGARHRGEIATLADIVRCDVGVITGIGKTHLSEFGSREAIARTKTELLHSLPASGVAIVPSDDDFLPLLVASTAARPLTVGPGGHVRFRATAVEQPGRTIGSVSIGDATPTLALPVPGRALMRNAAVAMAVGAEFGVTPAEAAGAIAAASLSSWRMQVGAIGPWTIVNDAYNANPTSTASALRTVRELAGTAPVWAVLGEMAELGNASSSEHRRMGRLAHALGYQGVIAVGAGASELAAAAGPIGFSAEDMAQAADLVIEHVPKGAHVVVKGSLVTGLKDFGGVLSDKLATPSRTP